MKLNKDRILVTKEELETLAKTFPKMTVLEFIELKKKYR